MPEDKKKITKALNNTLKSVCNIGARNKHKGVQRKKEIYTIQGLDIWKKEDIHIPKNIKAEQLSISTFYTRDDKGHLRRRTEEEQQEYYDNIERELKHHTRFVKRVKGQCVKQADEFLSFFENVAKPILVY